MNRDIAKILEKQLFPNERLLWAGQPKQGIVFRGSDLFLIPFSLLWAAFAFYWEWTAYTSGAPLFFLMFGGVFVVVGIYVVLGRFFVDAFVRSKTYYGISNNRILIATKFLTLTMKSLNL